VKLGFASAIVPDLSLEEVVGFAAAEGFTCVELMCWPKGKAERRYAGVTHVDVAGFTADDAAQVKDMMAASGVEISALGYYPNPLSADRMTPTRRQRTTAPPKKAPRPVRAFGIQPSLLLQVCRDIE